MFILLFSADRTCLDETKAYQVSFGYSVAVAARYCLANTDTASFAFFSLDSYQTIVQPQVGFMIMRYIKQV